ncbi:diiron oxygenase [Actinoplanes sp. NEAU-A12]|uniref:Diiron oxygenase n=1 Tax=Actinoplanes sandaracinus TaxID=3045177 RepID=A0ABT6WRC4_9ACTN|nr:diiron oxygenase [Actinoplanes sandaracinus]MDI6102288.1 diiron oxygenase [Actinoplanes sandaracinus]
MALEDLIKLRARRQGDAFHQIRYDSRFDHWEKRASVRSRPSRILEYGDADALYFPPELIPAVGHPIVREKGDAVARELLVRRLYQYLDFTTELEEIAVIPVVSKISRRRSGLELPAGMQSDAFKILTDEAWHAQFSHELALQVEQQTGVPVGTPVPPAFLRRLDDVRRRLPAEVRGAETLMFAVVSETLISGILAHLPNDDRLPAAVRDQVRDHAEDEGRHHVYFRSVLRHLWPALTSRAHREIGPYIPEMIYAFLEPDYAAVGGSLRAVGLSEVEAEQVVSESWPRRRVAADVAGGARSIVKYLGEVGVLDDARTRDAFLAAGLLPADDSTDVDTLSDRGPKHLPLAG